MTKNQFFIAIWLIQILLIELSLINLTNISNSLTVLLLGIVTSIYLLFAPGSLVLRILNLKNLNISERIFLKIGISISILMILGFLLNVILPLLGNSNPLTQVILISAISSIVISMNLFYFFKGDKSFESPIVFLDIFKVISNFKANFLILLIFISIIGSFILNYNNNNIVLVILIILISMIILLNRFFEIIPKKFYPLAIFSISLALLFHNSLISFNIWGGDIQFEYSFANLVINNSYWDYTMPNNYNGMLSVVILAPFFSIIGKIDLNWVFKIIYPLIFSMVPLVLYNIYKTQMEDKIALLSSFFFVSISAFYFIMPQLGRQMIAELFFVLLIMLTLTKKINGWRKSLIYIIFGISLVVSHYGLSYIYIFYLMFFVVAILISKHGYLKNRLRFKKSQNTYILIFIVFALSWYIYISSSSSFITIIGILNNIGTSFISDFMNPEKAQGVAIISTGAQSRVSSITYILHLISITSISIGAISLILFKEGKFKRLNKYFRFQDEYVILAMASLFLCISAILIPFVGKSLDTIRLYQITLIILSPLFILGFLTILELLKSLIKCKIKSKDLNATLKIVSIFLFIYLLFNSGFIHLASKESHPFSPVSVSIANNTDYVKFNEMEVNSADWLKKYKSSKIIYADQYRWLLIKSREWNVGDILNENTLIKQNNSYIYLGTKNKIESQFISFSRKPGSPPVKYFKSEKIILNKNKIFDNGGSEIYSYIN